MGLCKFSCPPPYPHTIKPYKLTRETNALVYCGLITQQFVGSDHVRCLRTFFHPTKYCDHAFQNVYYVPVEKRTFQDISILISDLNRKKSLSRMARYQWNWFYIFAAHKNLTSLPSTVILTIDPLVSCYRKQADRGLEDIGPIYSIPPLRSADMASVAYWQVYSGLIDPLFGVVPSQ